MEDKSLPDLTDTRATLLVLNPSTINHPLSCSTKKIQIVGISNKPQEVSVLEHIPFCLGPLKDTYLFLLSFSDHPFIRSRLLREVYRTFFLPKGESNSRIDSSYQSSQPGELNDSLTSFICFVFDGTRVYSGNTDHLPLLNQLPPSLLAKFTAHLPSRFK